MTDPIEAPMAGWHMQLTAKAEDLLAAIDAMRARAIEVFTIDGVLQPVVESAPKILTSVAREGDDPPLIAVSATYTGTTPTTEDGQGHQQTFGFQILNGEAVVNLGKFADEVTLLAVPEVDVDPQLPIDPVPGPKEKLG